MAGFKNSQRQLLIGMKITCVKTSFFLTIYPLPDSIQILMCKRACHAGDSVRPIIFSPAGDIAKTALRVFTNL